MVYDVGNCDGVDDDDDNVDYGEEEDPNGSARNKKVERFSQNSRDNDDDH